MMAVYLSCCSVEMTARMLSVAAGMYDNARELILESALRGGCSDGEIEAGEGGLLRAIAAALGIGEGLLEP